MEESSKFYTTQEIADHLQVTKKTVRELIARQELQAYKIGREFRINPDDFKQFLENQKMNGKGEI